MPDAGRRERMRRIIQSAGIRAVIHGMPGGPMVDEAMLTALTIATAPPAPRREALSPILDEYGRELLAGRIGQQKVVELLLAWATGQAERCPTCQQAFPRGTAPRPAEAT